MQHDGGHQERKVVLAVEDEPSSREALRLILGESYDLVFADDGPAAVDLVKRRPPDLILLDLGLLAMGGLDLLAEVRTMAPEVPIVILTLTTTLQRTRRAMKLAMKLGAIEYFTKRFEAPTVLSKNHEALTAPGAGANGPGCDLGREGPRPQPAIRRADVRSRCLVLAGHLGTAATLRLILARHVIINVAIDAVSAIGLLNASEPDCIICDEQAWITEGVALARAVRAKDLTCRIALVAGINGINAHGRDGQLVDAVIPANLALGELVRRTLGLCAAGRDQWSRQCFDKRLMNALDYLRLQYAEAVTAKTVAETAAVSRSRLAALFRKELGMTFTGYLAALRVQVAKLLLERGNVNLEEVAYQSGFCDASHLSRLFRAQMGHRPGAYRRAFSGAITLLSA
jgi:AraC-like DNA-binding protein/CheY-like chemotaxis protein